MISVDDEPTQTGLVPTKEPPRMTPVAPQLLDPSMNPITGRLRLRMSATTDAPPDAQPLTRPTAAAVVRKFANLDPFGTRTKPVVTPGQQQQQPYSRADITVPDSADRKRFLQEATADNARFDENIYLTKLLSMVSKQLARDSSSLEDLKQLDANSAKAEYAIDQDEEKVLEDVGAAQVQRVHPTMSKGLAPFRKVLR